MSTDAFASLVHLVPEPMLLVSADGLIRAANQAFARLVAARGAAWRNGPLAEQVTNPPAQVLDYLRQCAGTNQPVPGRLSLRGSGEAQGRRCEGWVVQPRRGSEPAVVAVRFLARDAALDRFRDHTRQIRELTAEITRRRRAEADLASTLAAQTALQHRFALLADAPATLLASLSTDDVHRALGVLSRQLVAADAYAIWHFDPEAGRWRVVWSEHLSDAFVDEIASSDTGAPGPAPFDGPLAVSDVSSVPLLADRRRVYEQEGIRSLLIIPLRIRGANHGTIATYFRTPTSFSDEERRVAATLGSLGSSALTIAALHEVETAARRDLEGAARRARFLARAGAALGRSLDYEDTLRTVAQLAVPEVADWCAVDVHEDGVLKRVAVAHGDPAKTPIAQLLRERYPEDPSSPYGVHQALRTKEPILITRIPASLVRSAARNDEHLEMLETLGLHSYICVPLVAHGRALGVLTLVSAESRREYTEADLGLAQEVAARAALAVENARAYDEATRANRLKDDFLATLSHELRTPLNAILGYVRMLRADVVAPERRPHALEIVERNATALTRMVEDILDVSRVVSGKIRLNVQPVDLPRIVQDAIGTVSPAADAKGIRIEPVLDTGCPPVSGDPARLQQVAWNLLSNAVKFTPRGGRVQVRVERVGSHVEIVVSDTGIGIPADFLPHVFERFRQADARFSREQGGLGLGLAIARHFVELHGGAIAAASDGPGRGATFRVELPPMIVHQEARPSPRTHPSAEGAFTSVSLSSIAGVHVLAVDDEPDSLALVREVLTTAGARVTTAASVVEALAALEREPPDVVLTDLGMPGMDGFELVARLRQSADGALSRMPIAALTAYARSEDRIRSLERGFHMHLSKPINPPELVAAVRVLANLRAAEAER